MPQLEKSPCKAEKTQCSQKKKFKSSLERRENTGQTSKGQHSIGEEQNGRISPALVRDLVWSCSSQDLWVVVVEEWTDSSGAKSLESDHR